MEFRELKSLAALAETGSITQTARLVHLTSAAVHKQLKQLEEDLGVPLYERREGRLCLTPAAELFMPYAREMIGTSQSARAVLDEWKGLRRGLLRIGAGPSLAIYVLSDLLSAYGRRFPSIDVDVQTGSSVQLMEQLSENALDLILLVGSESLENTGIQVAAELPSEIVLVSTAKGVPARCPLSRLVGYPFLSFRKGARIANLIQHYLDECAFVPNVQMRFDSAEALKAALLKQSAIAFLPRYTVAEEIRQKRLVLIRQTEHKLFMRAQLVRRRIGFVPPAVEGFVSIAREAWEQRGR